MGCQPMRPWTYTFSLRYCPEWGLNPGLLGYIPGALPLSYLAMGDQLGLLFQQGKACAATIVSCK